MVLSTNQFTTCINVKNVKVQYPHPATARMWRVFATTLCR